MASLKSALGSGGTPIGGIIDGALDHDARFVRANGSRYPVASYPDLAPLYASGQLTQYTESTSMPVAIQPRLTGNDVNNIGCVDGNRILLPSRRGDTSDQVTLLSVSNDNGATWIETSLTTGFIAANAQVTVNAGYNVFDIAKTATDTYVAVLMLTTSQTGKPIIVRSIDGGMTWIIVRILDNVTGSPASVYGNMPRILVDSTGNKVLVTSYAGSNTTHTYASYDGGQSWAAGSLQANAAARYIQTDGTNLFYTQLNTTLTSGAWPASGGINDANLASITSKFPSSVTDVKKIGNRYVAYNRTQMAIPYMCSSTTLTGTYTTTNISTGLANSAIIDVSSVGSLVFILATDSSGVQELFYATDSASISTVTRRTATTELPFSGASTITGFTQQSRFFQTFGTALNSVYAWYGALPFSFVSTANGTSFTTHATVSPEGFSASLFKQGANFFGARSETTLHLNQTYHFKSPFYWFRSTDLNNWTYVDRFLTAPVRTLNRFVALNSSYQIVRSSDGITFATTGVTQPASMQTGGTVKYRLFAVNNLIYLAIDGNPTPRVYVSSNEGASWTNISIANMFGNASSFDTYVNQFWFGNKPIAYFAGLYHLTNVYADAGVNYLRRAYSTDGISWISPTGNNDLNVSSLDAPTNTSAFVVEGKLYLVSAGTSGSNTYIYTSTDGYSFIGGYYAAPVGATAERLDEILQPSYFASSNVRVTGQVIGADEYVYISANDSGVNGSFLIFKNGVLVDRLAALGASGGLRRVAAQAIIDNGTEWVLPSYRSIQRAVKTNKTFQSPAASTAANDYIGLSFGSYMKVAE